MRIEKTFDQIHSAVTSRWWMQLYTAFVRVLLGLAFIPPSIPKIMHKPFTVLPDSHPVGHYFNALYQTGFYYEFLGWSQITAAALLLIPRTSHIGSLAFLPIIVNIAVLTSSVGFKGTWLITILMSLAAMYLVFWEYDRLKPIIFRTREDKTSTYALQWLMIPAFFAFGGIGIGILWWLIGLGNFADYFKISVILVLVGAIFGVLVTIHYHLMPAGKLDSGPKEKDRS